MRSGNAFNDNRSVSREKTHEQSNNNSFRMCDFAMRRIKLVCKKPRKTFMEQSGGTGERTTRAVEDFSYVHKKQQKDPAT